MAPIIGFALLLLVFSIGIFLPFFNFFSYKKIQISELEKISSQLVAAIFLAALLTQICLIFSFVISDYSVTNIYKNSHHLKPLIYKISGSWGNHEGSMLLLISVISAYTFFFAFFSKINAQKKLVILSSQSFIIATFAAFTAFTSNPFERIFPVPTEGLGLNPLLQDIGLALHPPMLYVGYVGFSLILSFALAGLLCEKFDGEFVAKLKPWLFFSYAFLTLGIGLGSWWAYRELGWGGYWFWDPVENISLMPWLAATALIHAVKLVEKKEIFKSWSAFLAILTFILCLIGIFLTRSGILTSVHSFAIDASRGFFVIALILLIGGTALLIFGAKMNSLYSSREAKNLRSNSSTLLGELRLILFNNYFLLLALFIVLLGTVYPIFSRGFFDEFISIGPSYYNQVFSFLIVPFLIFLALSSNKKNFLTRRNALIFLASTALTSLTFFYHQQVNFLQIVILFLAIFTALSPISYRLSPMNIAHFAFSLIIIGIVLTTSFGLTKEVNLQKNQSLKIGNYELNFSEIEYYAGKNFIARQGNFVISENGKELGSLQPQLRYYPINEQTTNEASIRHGIFGDLYLVIGTKDENENYALRAYYKPFIYLLWLGCFLIFFAAILQIFQSQKFKIKF